MEITMHDNHAAVNVKVYICPPIEEGEYERLVGQWWEDATLLAHEHGYSGVFSEGRSGGWCVPFYQESGGKVHKFAQWPGQGPKWGYPRYPDMEDAKEQRKFVKFERAILRLVQDYLKEARSLVCNES